MSGTEREKKYYKAFRKKYAGIYKTQDGWTKTVLSTKKLRIASGLVFYFPSTTIKASGYITNTPSIFNYPVQSFATADIIPITLVILWHLTKGLESFIVNTIHDSILIESHPEELELMKGAVKEAFTGASLYSFLKRVYNVDFDVPLGGEMKIGDHWGEGEKFTYKANI